MTTGWRGRRLGRRIPRPDHLERQVHGGIRDTTILPGTIGETGTLAYFHDAEQHTIRAAARAGARTCTTVDVHTTAPDMHALRITRVCEREGLAPSRLYFSHRDEVLGLGYHRQVLEQGSTIGSDTRTIDQLVLNHDDHVTLRPEAPVESVAPTSRPRGLAATPVQTALHSRGRGPFAREP
ncbi:hypothetical protein [Embleya scabrispora]|uniref:phosphotriesterase family protein n=1 Tax=Embleya scabrispora TaxID=159449 RepID=UPI001374FE6F|nr:hypothetical protein [Embleya scabrispora]